MMRTHTKLTPSQIAANAAFAAAHPAVRAAVKMRDEDAVAHLRAAGLYAQTTLGWTTRPNTMNLVRKLERVRDHATPQRDERAPGAMRINRTDRPLEPHQLARKAIWRIPEQRCIMVSRAATGFSDNLRHDIEMVSEFEEPSYVAQPDERDPKRWVHRIRIPRDWMTRVAPLFNCSGHRLGTLGYREFPLDVRLCGDEMWDGSAVYQVTRVRASRGFKVTIDTVYVAWWSPSSFSVHKTLKAANAAPAPEWFVEKRAYDQAMFEVDMGVIRSLEFQD